MSSPQHEASMPLSSPRAAAPETPSSSPRLSVPSPRGGPSPRADALPPTPPGGDVEFSVAEEALDRIVGDVETAADERTADMSAAAGDMELVQGFRRETVVTLKKFGREVGALLKSLPGEDVEGVRARVEEARREREAVALKVREGEEKVRKFLEEGDEVRRAEDEVRREMGGTEEGKSLAEMDREIRMLTHATGVQIYDRDGGQLDGFVQVKNGDEAAENGNGYNIEPFRLATANMSRMEVVNTIWDLMG